MESQSSIFAISILLFFPKEYSYEARIKSKYQSTDDCLHLQIPFFIDVAEVRFP